MTCTSFVCKGRQMVSLQPKVSAQSVCVTRHVFYSV